MGASCRRACRVGARISCSRRCLRDRGGRASGGASSWPRWAGRGSGCESGHARGRRRSACAERGCNRVKRATLPFADEVSVRVELGEARFATVARFVESYLGGSPLAAIVSAAPGDGPRGARARGRARARRVRRAGLAVLPDGGASRARPRLSVSAGHAPGSGLANAHATVGCWIARPDPRTWTKQAPAPSSPARAPASSG